MRPEALYKKEQKHEDTRSVLAPVGLDEGPVAHRICGKPGSPSGLPVGITIERDVDGKTSSNI